ncbi:MAG: ABC transporter substrate-binding protein [Acidihalobacter sp.]
MDKQESTNRRRGWRSALVLGAALCIGGLANVAAAATIKFGVPPWPGVTVKTEVARQLLGAMGYDTAVTNAGVVIDLQGVARGDLTAMMAAWMPAQKKMVDPLVKSGKIKLLSANVPDALYAVVVPDYVCKAGVHSMTDLHRHADKFDHKIYGIEAGSAADITLRDAIKKNTFNLGSWQLVPSSTAGMLSQAGRAIREHKWIAFLGWKPHWMNIKYKLCYLNDPKKLLGGKTTVYTVVNPEFVKNQPNAVRFLKQMVVYSKAQSQWIYDYGYKKQKADAVATAWIKANMDTISKWLEGVKTADGSKPAIEAVKAKFGA